MFQSDEAVLRIPRKTARRGRYIAPRRHTEDSRDAGAARVDLIAGPCKNMDPASGLCMKWAVLRYQPLSGRPGSVTSCEQWLIYREELDRQRGVR